MVHSDTGFGCHWCEQRFGVGCFVRVVGRWYGVVLSIEVDNTGWGRVFSRIAHQLVGCRVDVFSVDDFLVLIVLYFVANSSHD